MVNGGIRGIEIVFLVLLLSVVIFALLARKLKTPYPIVLVVAGLLISFVPGIPHIALNSNVVFLSSSAAIAVFRGMADFVARVQIQPGEHPFAGFWAGGFHGAGNRGNGPLGVPPVSTGGWDLHWEQWCRPPMRSRPRRSQIVSVCHSASWTFWKARAW